MLKGWKVVFSPKVGKTVSPKDICSLPLVSTNGLQIAQKGFSQKLKVIFIFITLSHNNMKKIIPLFLIICTFQAPAQSKSYDYAYSNKKGLCVYSLADKKETLIVMGHKGTDPCISADGAKLAYTANSPKGDRTIVVIDLNTKKKITLNVGSNNCYGPVWSPDGKWIACNVFNAQTSKWAIAVIDPGNNSPPKIVTKKLEDAFAPTWTADSKNIAVQNLYNVFVVDMTGNISNQYKVSDLTNTDGPSSSDKFVLAADRKKIVFSSEVNEDSDSDGPPSAVFVYDIAGKATIRLTPKGYFAGGVWVKNNKVLFTASRLKSTVQNIYTVDLDGKNLKILFPNCSDISARY